MTLEEKSSTGKITLIDQVDYFDLIHKYNFDEMSDHEDRPGFPVYPSIPIFTQVTELPHKSYLYIQYIPDLMAAIDKVYFISTVEDRQLSFDFVYGLPYIQSYCVDRWSKDYKLIISETVYDVRRSKF